MPKVVHKNYIAEFIEHRETNEQMKMMIDDVVDKVFNAIGFAALCPSSNQIRAVAEKRIKVENKQTKYIVK